MLDDQFVSQLGGIVGKKCVLLAEDLIGRDPGIDPTNLDAGVCVMPETVRQISEVCAICNAHGVSIVPHGGLTGLAGAATSRSGQLIVGTGRLRQTCDIDPEGETALVSAGITLLDLSDAAASYGLCAGIDIGARGTATIGGMLATNAGGGEAFRNGVMRHRVLGLEAVTADGTIMSDLKRVSKANEGLDLKQLFVGSEGTLGIITHAVLKLEPAETSPSTALVACDNAADALQLFQRLKSSRHSMLVKAEIMWRDYAKVTARDLGLSSLLDFADRPVYVLFDIAVPSGTAPDVETILVEAMSEVGLEDAVLAQSESQRSDMWRIREDSWGVQRQHPHGLWFDVSVPRSEIDGYLEGVRKRMSVVDPELLVFVMGHLGDGNLHFTVTKGVPVDEQYSAISKAVYEGLIELGGSFSAEHGIGTEKKSALAKYGDPGSLTLMKCVKSALDPNGIMNPGKIFD